MPRRPRHERLRDLWDRVHPSGLLYSTYEQRLQAQLDVERLPKHVAVMADGNRRWARMNAPREPLEVGYQVGAAKLHEFANWCEDLGIPMITLWVLSPENFARPAEEIGPLLEIIAKLVEDLAATGRWQVQIVGDLDLLPRDNVERLLACQEATASSQGLHINVAVSYGGRHELRDAVRSLLATKSAEGATLEELAETIEIDDISDHLYTKGQPDPDLVIRTSGEQRLSGFLIWQSAHSEFYFHEALWPDFRKVDFIRVLRTFTRRERRFGS